MKVVVRQTTRIKQIKFVTGATRPTGWWLSCGEVFLSFHHGRLLLDRVPASRSLYSVDP